MKRLLLIPFLILVCFSGQAQGEYDNDSCDFRDSCSLVQPLSDTGLWQIGTPSKVFFSQAGGGVRGLLTDSANYYPANNDAYFEVRFKSSSFVVFFEFWHRFDTDTLADGGYIEVSYDEGVSWQDIQTVDSNHIPMSMGMYGTQTKLGTLGNGKKGFSGRSRDTVYTLIEWTWDLPLKSTPEWTWLRFYFYSDSVDNGKEGWMIDRFKLFYPEVWGFDELTNPHRVKAYPNPGNGIFTLESLTESETRYELIVYDFKGKRILKQTLTGQKQSNLDLSVFPSGMYFYTLLEQGSVVYSGKLVKE